MTTQTLTKEAAQAVAYFEAKLEFEIGPISLKYALEKKEPLQIIDLRTPELFAKGHVPGAINILYEDLAKHFSKLNKDKTVITYCYDSACNLSTKAALELTKHGFKAKELHGGWETWAEKKLPVDGKAEASSCSTSSKSSCG